MQENGAFDHCFGALQGVRGDPRAISLPNKSCMVTEKQNKEKPS
ncbi:hypothetical protein [Flavivirga spongiicola]|uniref:Uncharacterized protein n=1 Tax=Flavivirga spongiicola TaxID=421621 RepID=A0ABU7XNC2_9FLAO|nr:hypothetical protein [Flavivirga sp. MEBiC05379]MDO5980161.1 hypothetical protein [Flavivirga sp. MEBiC05379]MDO5981909.1 hypothetical protein [Flavivirga sp. MEBiC05379]